MKDDRYVLGAEIARGGMGRVVTATDNLLGREVAIKEALTPDEDLRLRFLRETKITARLEHPSIVPVYDAGTMSDGSPFYVMRRVSGKPLEKLVSEAPTLALRLALLPNLLAAANAVAHAHRRGIVHRDLKPANILVGELGETVVIDWGLAKIIDEPDDATVSAPLPPSSEDHAVQTRIGSVVGTPGFMPPEQLRGESVDARSDVYALGATLYYLLAQRAPHAARTGAEMMSAALAGPPTPLRELIEGVPRELLTIVDKAQAYTSESRYHDAGGLAADLDRFLKGQLVASHRYSRRERLVRFWRRHRLAISVVAIAAVTLIVGGTLAVTRVVAARKRADVALADALVRNESLQLARARDMLRMNPRGAVEMVRPLAAKYWKESRSIALAARAVGIPRSLAGATYTRSIDLNQAGTQAVTGGEDGIIRVHDLVARKTREIANLGGKLRAVYADDDRAVVVSGGGFVRLVDPATGGVRDLFPLPEPSMMRALGRQLWWLDTDGKVWSRGLDDAASKSISVDDRVWHFAPHASGVALAGFKHLWLVVGADVVPISEGKVTSVAWIDADSLAAVIDRHVVVIELSNHTQRTIDGVGNARDVFATASGALVVRGLSGRITVVDPNVMLELPPTSWIGELYAAPHSPYVLAGVDEELLVWDLRETAPHVTPLGPGFVHGNLDHDQYVITHSDNTASWIDLPTGRTVKVPVPGALSAAVLEPGAGRAIICENDGRGRLYVRGQPEPTPLDGTCKMGIWMGDVAVIGSPNGEIRLFDPVTRSSKFLLAGTSPPWAFYRAGDWVACLFDDNGIWRYNIKTGQTSQLPKGTDRWVMLREDGEAYVSDLATVRVWRPDGSFGEPLAVPSRPGKLLWIDPTHLFVVVRGDTGYVVDLTTKQASQVYPPGSRLHSIQLKGELGVYVNEDESLWLTSPFTGDRWLVAKPASAPLWLPNLTSDHTKAYAVAGGNLLTWDLPVARSRDETLALIQSLLD